jgi:hypothetical protein
VTLTMKQQWAMALCLLLAGAMPARAQSLSTETALSGTIDASFDFLASTARRRGGGFEWYLPGVTVGLPRRSEAGVSWSGLAPASPDEPRELIPHAKWRFLERENGLSAAVGVDWHLPTAAPRGPAAYGLVFVALSHPVTASGSATVYGGVYRLVQRGESADTRRGIWLGWDHTLSSRWSYSIEWVTGNNWYGYFTPQVTFANGPQWVSAGYCVGNSVHANHGPCVSVGRTF